MDAFLLPGNDPERSAELPWHAELERAGFTVRVFAGNRTRDYSKDGSAAFICWKAEQIRELARMFDAEQAPSKRVVIVALDACPMITAAVHMIRVAADRRDIRFIAVHTTDRGCEYDGTQLPSNVADGKLVGDNPGFEPVQAIRETILPFIER